LDERPKFSEIYLAIVLPANFLVCVHEICADSLLVLIAFFQLMSQQEQPGAFALAFDLKTNLTGELQQKESQLQAAFNELHNAGLLFSWIDPHNSQKTYLIPGTPEGIETYSKLCENPELVDEFHLAKILRGADRPNIFKIYEDNFGTLTPMMAEMIKADLELYPIDWVEDAMKEAVEYNARNWKYVQAILRNWQEKGRKGTNEEGKRDLDKFRKLYLEQKRKH
jgi:DnaD/phage-associated family protein